MWCRQHLKWALETWVWINTGLIHSKPSALTCFRIQCSRLICPIYASRNTLKQSNCTDTCINSYMSRLSCPIPSKTCSPRLLLQKRMKPSVATNNIINKSQISFLPEKWTMNNIFTLQIPLTKVLTSPHLPQNEEVIFPFTDFLK